MANKESQGMKYDGVLLTVRNGEFLSNSVPFLKPTIQVSWREYPRGHILPTEKENSACPGRIVWFKKIMPHRGGHCGRA
jgi:hypothetical protein